MRSRRSLKLSHTQTSVPCGTLNNNRNVMFHFALNINYINNFILAVLLLHLKQEESARERALCQLTECF